ncbi:hypothetical protein [Paracnuella aquatica]|uniref:hypothetical protein n=1 Tax=Paracnuella aquatica TaxID=2268757 RepID=UPI0013903849|nr:hypothetical protein [Paracnuella aquatica]
MNTSMFFPVMEEMDLYDARGVQVDDVNSVVEYIVQDVLMSEHDKQLPADDEDNDQPHYFHLHKEVKKIVPPEITLLPEILPATKPHFFSPDFLPLPKGCSDIVIPPPKA